jgi:hypothetical protein
MIIGNIRSHADLAKKKQLQMDLLEVEVGNEAELEKRVKDYKNPYVPKPVPPIRKTRAELMKDIMELTKSIIDKFRDIDVPYEISSGVLSEYNNDPDKLIQINLGNERDKSIIDTQDNLTPAVFRKIHDIIGLKYLDGYESKKTHIERNLVEHRNSIGHGNKRLSSNEDFLLEIASLKELRDIILLIIENFRDDIIQFAKEGYYLRDNLGLIDSYCICKEDIISRELNAIQSKYNNE